MNKKGFTLVEVILVIAILAILLLVLIPNVFVMIEKNEKKSCMNLRDNIESAAKMYVTNNKYELGFSCSSSLEIKLGTLIESGDLTIDSSGIIKNPIDNEILYDNSTDSVSVTVTYDCSSKTFTYDVEGVDC